MSRVHTVEKSRKEFPGIPKGSKYYYWEFRHGGIRRSLTYPKRSQLTQSAFYSAMFSLQDEYVMPDVELQDLADLESLTQVFEDAKEDIKSQLEWIRDECQESLDNMPESLQYAPTGELLQSRVDAMDAGVDEIDNVDTDFDESLLESDDEDEEPSSESDSPFLSEEVEQQIILRFEEITEELQEALNNIEVE